MRAPLRRNRCLPAGNVNYTQRSLDEPSGGNERTSRARTYTNNNYNNNNNDDDHRSAIACICVRATTKTVRATERVYHTRSLAAQTVAAAVGRTRTNDYIY